MKTGWRNTREILVTWQNIALDKAEWVAEADFDDLVELQRRLKEYHPREQKS